MVRLLVRAGAIRFGGDHPFRLAAGWASPVYVDCRVLIGDPAIRRATIDLLLATLQTAPCQPFDAVAGGETAGIPWASLLAERLDLPLLYVRKRPLGIGRHAQVEGASAACRHVLLVDDLATDLRSKAAFVSGLRNAGATVTDVAVLFFQRVFASGTERLSRLGLTLHSVADWGDVLKLDLVEPFLNPRDRAALQRFLLDPVAWSAAHEGRHRP